MPKTLIRYFFLLNLLLFSGINNLNAFSAVSEFASFAEFDQGEVVQSDFHSLPYSKSFIRSASSRHTLFPEIVVTDIAEEEERSNPAKKILSGKYFPDVSVSGFNSANSRLNNHASLPITRHDPYSDLPHKWFIIFEVFRI